MGISPRPASLAIEKLPDGNINWVRRARERGGRSWVVKQARPALERFPEYSAPTERIVFEARYYERAAPFDPGGVCPRVHRFDPEARVLVLEDLSRAERLDARLARGGPDDPGVVAAAVRLAGFLGRVHAGTGDSALAAHFANEGMQRLHGDHVFRLPYRPNDFPLSAALVERAREIWHDAALVASIDRAYERYLGAREALVHGDVQPANVMLAERGAVLLDAEIAHVGDPAFDPGCLFAHLLLEAAARGDGDPACVGTAWCAYRDANPRGPDYREVARYAGIEMLRRTLGAARVAAVEEDAAALRVVERGVALVRRPPDAPPSG